MKLIQDGHFLPGNFDLTPASRHPIQLNPESEKIAAALSPAFPSHSGSPQVSIIVATHNNLALTRLCLASITAHTDLNYELILVDNASTDGTVGFLNQFRSSPFIRVILNERNEGFAPAINRGVLESRGDTIVLLNNDVLVPPGWLYALLDHLESEVGAVGPVTNRIGNEAEVDTAYRTFGEYLIEAGERASNRKAESTAITMLAMFCFAIRRETWNRIGPLDEQFEIGMFEDDDYAKRLHAAGFKTLCAEDVLVHHFGQAAFGSLVPTGEYARLFEANRERFNQKWKCTWQPHQRRRAGYQALIETIRSIVERVIPPNATIAMVSKGDSALLDLPRHSAIHFPQGKDGGYLGHHPATDEDAIEAVERATHSNVQFLLFPSTAYWWFERYPQFTTLIEERFETIHRDASCRIVDLSRSPKKMSL